MEHIEEIVERVKKESGGEIDLSGIEIQIGSKPAGMVSDKKFTELLGDAVDEIKDSEGREERESNFGDCIDDETRNEGGYAALMSVAGSIQHGRRLLTAVSLGNPDKAIDHILHLIYDFAEELRG